jgi:hypothetical protein
MHSTAQQKVTGERNRIVIEPVVRRFSMFHFMTRVWRTGNGRIPFIRRCGGMPRGYLYTSDVGFARGRTQPLSGNTDWIGTQGCSSTVPSVSATIIVWPELPGSMIHSTGTLPAHQNRVRYGRDFASGRETKWSFRGCDDGPASCRATRWPYARPHRANARTFE